MTRDLKWLIAIAAMLLLPAASTGIVYYYAAGTFTAVQSFNDGKLSLNGSSSGASVLHAPSTGGGAVTLFAGSDTVAGLGTVQTWTAAQSFTDGDAVLLGSSSGSSALHTSATGGGAITFQAGAHTVAALTLADQTVSGGANVTSQSQSAGNITVDCGKRPAQYIANTGAFTITAPASDGYCYLDVENGSGAGAVSVSGFSPNSIGGAALDTTNGHNFRLVISEVHGHANIVAIALQ